MSKIYAALIEKEVMSLEDVPEKNRKEVKAILAAKAKK